MCMCERDASFDLHHCIILNSNSISRNNHCLCVCVCVWCVCVWLWCVPVFVFFECVCVLFLVPPVSPPHLGVPWSDGDLWVHP